MSRAAPNETAASRRARAAEAERARLYHDIHSAQTTPDEAEFVRQCGELGEKINSMLFSYPKPVAICVLTGAMAAIAMALNVPRDTMIAMFDSALENMRDGGPIT